MTRRTTPPLLFAALLALAATEVRAQIPLTTPQGSQRATVSQTIGLTEISVVYSRPGVNKRKVWGELVPYGEVWRAGANENTVVSFSTPVTIEGKALAAGKYGLHTVPAAGEWTVAFSSQANAWGSFSYDQKEDALRVTVKPTERPFEERLSYTFDDPTSDSVTLALNWEKLRVPIKVGVDVKTTVPANLRDQLRGIARFSWQGWQQAANWCFQNDTNMEEASGWSDRAIAANRTFATLRLKAAFLEKKGDAKGATALRDEAMQIATEADMNNFGYTLIGQGKLDDALKIFKTNTEKHPKSWNVWDSLGEALAAKGDKAGAKANYQKALDMTTDDVQKKRIQGILAKL